MALKKLQQCPYVVRYISSGRQDEFNFLVMQRLGDNVAELRKKLPGNCFSITCTCQLGVQMLEAIEGCHQLAYIHRDVKPSNFVLGTGSNRRVYLIDFGLARKYRLQGGDIRPARKAAGFRGTARYASINSHHCKELGRRDDLWSLFYVLVEFQIGQLPWRRIKDKDTIGEIKEKHTNADLVKELPDEFRLFMDHLQQLDYATDPDYVLLRGLLNDRFEHAGGTEDTPYDWEVAQQTSSQRTRDGGKSQTRDTKARTVPQGSSQQRALPAPQPSGDTGVRDIKDASATASQPPHVFQNIMADHHRVGADIEDGAVGSEDGNMEAHQQAAQSRSAPTTQPHQHPGQPLAAYGPPSRHGSGAEGTSQGGRGGGDHHMPPDSQVAKRRSAQSGCCCQVL
eukprot:NODE_53_length_1552_cov_125.289713_g50_i0.p1 GENE.NODE_53_length_1552_cov_125.289713_g50_i0~~NODE_53_length_1552_cov_125.289713_g50_i0.p1  ORF type:complete len:465 (+),score=75.45 NODE_53_length_1552_cov_125.289713_g50_i0:210-1397(+)